MTSSNNSKIIGVVLCGGKSSRMGSDKGLLSLSDAKWFEANYHLLSNLFSKTVISINHTQSFSYKKFRPDLEYVEDSVDFAQGPLTGILSVHEKYPEYDLFVLACDMIKVEESTIQKLISVYKPDSNYDFYFYQNEIYLETLCGIYTANGLRELSRKLRANETKNFGIHKLISDSESLIIRVSEENKKSFANFNTPEEVDSEF